MLKGIFLAHVRVKIDDLCICIFTDLTPIYKNNRQIEKYVKEPMKYMPVTNRARCAIYFEKFGGILINFEEEMCVIYCVGYE